jgi:hypothetical protein
MQNEIAENEPSHAARDTAIKRKWEHAREQAQAQFESIKEMVQDLECAESEADPDADTFESAQQRIHEDALSVEVRSDWYMPGSVVDGAPVEYRILLCTGGPAVQIAGTLSEHGEPETARLEMQDWFLPWTEYRPTVAAPHGETHIDTKAEEILLTYAREFYFGE